MIYDIHFCIYVKSKTVKICIFASPTSTCIALYREKEQSQIHVSVFPFNFIYSYITWGRFDLGQI
jgi:hypothetical protein